MFAPPPLGRNDLDQLVAFAGGDKAACRLLDITARTLRYWRAGQRAVPQSALRLLWYAGPHGQHAAAEDLFNEVRMLRLLASALDRQRRIPAEAERFLASLRGAVAPADTAAASDYQEPPAPTPSPPAS